MPIFTNITKSLASRIWFFGCKFNSGSSMIKISPFWALYFIYKSNTLSESGCDLPLASVNFDKLSGFSGDGIIDLSYYIQYNWHS